MKEFTIISIIIFIVQIVLFLTHTIRKWDWDNSFIIFFGIILWIVSIISLFYLVLFLLNISK